jgi:hypothetical protein
LTCEHTSIHTLDELRNVQRVLVDPAGIRRPMVTQPLRLSSTMSRDDVGGYAERKRSDL